MVKGFFSVREVVEQAVRTEALGRDFYTSMAGRFGDREDLKRLFMDLSAREGLHEQRFRGLLGALGDEGVEGWEEVSEYMRAFVESEFFLGSDKALARMKDLQGLEDALAFALAFEKETLLYFVGLRKVVKEKEVVDEIIDEEQEHIARLVRERDLLLK